MTRLWRIRGELLLHPPGRGPTAIVDEHLLGVADAPPPAGEPDPADVLVFARAAPDPAELWERHLGCLVLAVPHPPEGSRIAVRSRGPVALLCGPPVRRCRAASLVHTWLGAGGGPAAVLDLTELLTLLAGEDSPAAAPSPRPAERKARYRWRARPADGGGPVRPDPERRRFFP